MKVARRQLEVIINGRRIHDIRRVVTDADLLYDTLRRVNIDFLSAGDRASEFLTENLKAKVAVLNSILNKDETKTVFSSRDEHPEWFHGLDTNCTTKVSIPFSFCSFFLPRGATFLS